MMARLEVNGEEGTMVWMKSDKVNGIPDKEGFSNSLLKTLARVHQQLGQLCRSPFAVRCSLVRIDDFVRNVRRIGPPYQENHLTKATASGRLYDHFIRPGMMGW